jgi:hypothetical protein
MKYSWFDYATWPLAALTGPCVIGVQIPLIAFAFGAAASRSKLSLLWCALALLVRDLLPLPEWIIYPLVGLVICIKTGPSMLGCFFLAFGLIPPITSEAFYFQHKKEVDDVRADLLSPDSDYALEEINPPDELLQGFPDFALKQRILDLWQRYAKRVHGNEFVTFDSSVRVFRYYPRAEDEISPAAVAFPMTKYCSLVFLRLDLPDLPDPYRFQLYHELAHATTRGATIIHRALTWRSASRRTVHLSATIFAISIANTFSHFSHASAWNSMLIFILAWISRRSIVDVTNNVANGASEALADSIALSHPYFQNDGKWLDRARSLSMRLSDELACIKIKTREDVDRRFSIYYRNLWLQRWIDAGAVGVYHTKNVNPNIPLAFALFAMAGYSVTLLETSSSLRSLLMWTLIVTLFLGPGGMGKIGFASNELLRQLDDALKARLSKGR